MNPTSIQVGGGAAAKEARRVAELPPSVREDPRVGGGPPSLSEAERGAALGQYPW